MVKKLVLCTALVGGLYANNAHAGLGADVAKKAVSGVSEFIDGNKQLNPIKGGAAQLALSNMHSVIEQQTDIIDDLKKGKKQNFLASGVLTTQTAAALALAPKIADFINSVRSLKSKAAQMALSGVTSLIESNKKTIDDLEAKLKATPAPAIPQKSAAAPVAPAKKK